MQIAEKKRTPERCGCMSGVQWFIISYHLHANFFSQRQAKAKVLTRLEVATR